MTTETKTLAGLFELQQEVEAANWTWFEALRDGGDAAAAKAAHKAALAEFRAVESALIAEGAVVECGRCGGKGVVDYGRVVLTATRRDGSTVSDRFCFECGGARTVPLRKHTFETQAPTRFKNWQKAQAQEAAKQADESAKLAAFTSEHPAEAAFLKAEFEAAHDDDYTFFGSMWQKVARFGSLTEKQMAVVTREIEKRAVLAVAKPCPTGTVTVEGVISGTFDSRGYNGNTKLNMKVALDGEWKGNTVGGTIPAKVWDAMNFGSAYDAEVPTRHGSLIGTRVRFTATVTQSDRDDHFGFFKSPKGVEVLYVNWNEEG